ncbi:hypothetical protein F4780DRAFT_570727 [Xylariomycetidae sp. FL0641]|nr:hypothetical protein F4780DRAFT_570727 [Xylariomycetidae sp. FL0641]
MVQKPLVLLSGADGQHVHPEVDVTYPTTGGQQNSGAAGLASFEQPLSDIGPSDSVNICVASAYQYSPPSSSSNTSAAAVGVPGGYGPSAVPSMSPTQQQEDRLTSTEIQAENKPALAKPHRSPLEGEKRKQTEQTRKWKACIRCRMQKKRCLPDERDPEKSDCLTCRAVSLDSKKVIHRLPCLRWKLTEVVIFREGGLNLTKRWEGVKVKDLAPRDWVGEPSRTIFMSLGLCSNPIALRVKKFRPKAGDVTARNWIDPDGERQVTPIAPYALADIHQTTQTYCRWSQAQHLRRLEVQSGPDNIDQADFLTKYFQLWFASRVTQGSAYLVGPEMLDMEPDYRPGYPYPGKINLPRMVSAQFDSFGHVYVLRPLRKEILEKLWEMMATKKACYFFTIYLTVFMMLHEISATSRDRHRHYEQNCRSGLYHDRKGHYTLESFVESLQEGGNIILSHWHYYKRDLQPLALDLNPKSSAVYSELLPHESELLTEAVQAYEIRERWPMVKATGYHRFDEDLYFVSQMFEENWQPRATFSR